MWSRPSEVYCAHDLDRVVVLADLAHRDGRAVLVHQRADALQEGEVLGLVLGEQVVLHVVGLEGRAAP